MRLPPGSLNGVSGRAVFWKLVLLVDYFFVGEIAMLRALIERLFARRQRWSSQRAKKARRRLLLEGLEPRQVLTGTPVVSIGDATVVEGNAGQTTQAIFDVTLSEASSDQIAIVYSTVAGTAQPGDYQDDGTQILWIDAGQTSATISINVYGDDTFEGDETFTVHLYGAYWADIADADGVGTIANDDVEPMTFAFDNVTVTEGNAGTQVATFTLTLSRPVAPQEDGASMWIMTSDSTATAGSDYVGLSQQIYFYTGETSKTIEVTIDGDTQIEADETFFVDLLGLTGGSYARGTGTIVNDDFNSPPAAEAGGPYNVLEGGQVTVTGLGSSDP